MTPEERIKELEKELDEWKQPRTGTMYKISDFIKKLEKTREDFGETCIYVRDVSWGGVALNKESKDKAVQAISPLREEINRYAGQVDRLMEDRNHAWDNLEKKEKELATVTRNFHEMHKLYTSTCEERDKLSAELRSLRTELWEGARIHGLEIPPPEKPESERLIHAYCGGIVKVRNALDEAQMEIGNQSAQLADAEREITAHKGRVIDLQNAVGIERGLSGTYAVALEKIRHEAVVIQSWAPLAEKIGKIIRDLKLPNSTRCQRCGAGLITMTHGNHLTTHVSMECPNGCGILAHFDPTTGDGLDFDLLSKFALGPGGARTGELRMAGYLEWRVTDAGMAKLKELGKL
jgi:predicted  nucleic acid-binding Zn-ribbon protein